MDDPKGGVGNDLEKESSLPPNCLSIFRAPRYVSIRRDGQAPLLRSGFVLQPKFG